MTWQEELKHWIKTQHGTAGWQQKLECFVANQRQFAFQKGYRKGLVLSGIDKWLEQGRTNKYFDYWLSTVEWPKHNLPANDSSLAYRLGFSKGIERAKEAITKNYKKYRKNKS